MYEFHSPFIGSPKFSHFSSQASPRSFQSITKLSPRIAEIPSRRRFNHAPSLVRLGSKTSELDLNLKREASNSLQLSPQVRRKYRNPSQQIGSPKYSEPLHPKKPRSAVTREFLKSSKTLNNLHGSIRKQKPSPRAPTYQRNQLTDRQKPSSTEKGVPAALVHSVKQLVTAPPSNKPYQKKTSEAYYIDHLEQTFQSLKLMKTLTPLPEREISKLQVYLPPTTKKTVIFDLDETLVHCVQDGSPAQVSVNVRVPGGGKVTVGINIRPYARQVLREAKNQFQVIVFTASHYCYADAILDYLDPQKTLIDYRFYRNNCIQMSGVFIKDLRIFQTRKLENIIIVDNSVHSFVFQLDNGIPIVSWHDDSQDKQLLNLIDYLKVLASARDVRQINRQSFRMDSFCEDYIKHKSSKWNQEGQDFAKSAQTSSTLINKSIQKNKKKN